MQIYNFDEFVNEVLSETPNTTRIDEGLLKRRTGNLVSKMLGGTEQTGTAIFKHINSNVDNLENAIDDWNKKHGTNVGKKGILELHIDRAKLDIEHLIVMTTLTSASFLTDVIVSNILNYRVLIRPIRNARIISLAYKYYLAIIRHSLQTSLITLNLASDLFFAQISANLSGHKKAMRDFAANLRAQITHDTITAMSGETMYDEKGNKFTLKNILNDEQMKRITSWMKTYKTTMDHQMNWDSKMGYNQNIYQETGRNVEQLVKASQDKEVQSLAEQFTTISNVAKQEAKEMVANYAQSVKQSAESRAARVCAKINMNMLDILEMFSIRKIDGYIDAFEEMTEIEKNEENNDNEIKRLTEALKNAEIAAENDKDKIREEFEKKLTDKDKENVLARWEEKGIKPLCKEGEFRNIAYGNANVTEILKRNGFSAMQVETITNGNMKVGDYKRLYLDTAKMFVKSKPKNTFGILDDMDADNIKIESADADKIYKWMRVDSIEDKAITKFLNRLDREDEPKSEKKEEERKKEETRKKDNKQNKE